jgi:hypothetical protein
MATSFSGGRSRSTRREPWTMGKRLVSFFECTLFVICKAGRELMLYWSNKITRRVPLVEQELLTLPEHLSSSSVFSGGSCYSIFSFMCMFCRSLFVLLYFFFWPLCCLFFSDIRILITFLVSPNYSCAYLQYSRF